MLHYWGASVCMSWWVSLQASQGCNNAFKADGEFKTANCSATIAMPLILFYTKMQMSEFLSVMKSWAVCNLMLLTLGFKGYAQLWKNPLLLDGHCTYYAWHKGLVCSTGSSFFSQFIILFICKEKKNCNTTLWLKGIIHIYKTLWMQFYISFPI